MHILVDRSTTAIYQNKSIDAYDVHIVSTQLEGVIKVSVKEVAEFAIIIKLTSDEQNIKRVKRLTYS
ncbi:hypothetical protein ACVWYG_001198 [Pedobacter sp. UYEF25]